MSWISAIYECGLCMAITWSDHSHCAYRLWVVCHKVCLSWSVVEIAYNKLDVSCHACFNLSRLHSGIFSHRCYTLTVAFYCCSRLSWSAHQSQWNIQMLSIKTYSRRLQASKQANVHTRAQYSLASVRLVQACPNYAKRNQDVTIT